MKKYFYGLLVLLIGGCKEKYIPSFTSPTTGYLVVEGVINKGPDSTYIELSRTNKIGASQKQYEAGATVRVEGNDNSSFSLNEMPSFAGRYSAPLHLNNGTQYRLRIKTLAGKEYLSDFAEVKATPPIDSISWQRENNGVQLYINTHDPQDKTRYYLWDYKETWEFHSAFKSNLKYISILRPTGASTPGIAYKDPFTTLHDTVFFKCWRSFVSNQLIIGSSAKLSKDLIYKPLLFIPVADRKISVLYSVILKQYAVTKAGYEFLEKMKKNTEESGSIFDAQPSQLKGNIYCVSNPDEPVIGYINISSVEEKRIFISNSQVPHWNFRTDCEEQKILNNPDSISDAIRSGSVPTIPLELFGNSIIYFGVTTPACVDCTLSGTNVKPPFWP